MNQGTHPSDLELEQAKLRPDIEVVRRYGESHPDAWVEVRFENDPPVRIVAVFAGNELSEHKDALRQLLAHPDRLEVCQAPWPLTHLEKIRAEVHELATTMEPGVFSQWGIGRGAVNVRLRADQEPLAEQLHERYGDAVDLTVGYLHYPDCVRRNHDGTLREAPVPIRPPLLPDEIDISVEGSLGVRSGQNLRTELLLHNRDSKEIVVMTNGQVTALVLDPVSNEVVGSFSGVQGMPLVQFRALPGESVAIPLLIGTASSVPSLGYATPPGRWVIEVAMGLGSRGSFRTPPLPITVWSEGESVSAT